jgi:hypothetical protein
MNSATANEMRSSAAAPIHLRLLSQSGLGPAVHGIGAIKERR